jgi:hypothetical protein
MNPYPLLEKQRGKRYTPSAVFFFQNGKNQKTERAKKGYA